MSDSEQAEIAGTEFAESMEDAGPSSPEFSPAREGETSSSAQMVKGRIGLLIILLMVALADMTLYQASGYSGPAVFLIGAAVLLFVGIPRRVFSLTLALLSVMLLLLSWRMAANGWWMQLAIGLWLLHCFTLALRGQVPFVLETLVFAAQCVPGGYEFFSRIYDHVREEMLGSVNEGKSRRLLNVGLPVAAAVLFGGVFVMANPDMVTWVSGRLGEVAKTVREFFFQFSLQEVLFWCVVGWLTGGLLRPVAGPIAEAATRQGAATSGEEETELYTAFRNTLLTVIVLFSVYLVVEFNRLWFREFPDGFYYSGYAHEGAAWLTVALALATLMLSLIFRGLTLNDRRLPKLRRLAWIWSALNFVLAAAVYNRMHIYIAFNGMTRMRVVGLLGITSVIGGFVLVLIKINSRRDLLWLVRRQLWVLAAVVFAYCVIPVDVLIHKYNVTQIMSGNLPPVVQITGHAVDNEALPLLLPLCAAQDERIRTGIQAMLAERFVAMEKHNAEADALGWTAWQRSGDQSYAALKAKRANWDTFMTEADRQHAWEQLHDYAYKNWW